MVHADPSTRTVNLTSATLGVTSAACGTCRRLVPAKIETDGRGVALRRFCPVHGELRVPVSSDLDHYLRVQRCVRPGWRPRRFAGNASVPCPDGCGFCERHEQHLCLPIVEITRCCDLACPICISAAGGPEANGKPDLTAAEFRSILDRLVESEGQIDVLTLSGGEPLLHPDLPGLLDEALSRPQVVRIGLSTNGLALLREPRLAAELKARNVVVSLQFDGFDDAIYAALRGRPLLAEKRAILGVLRQHDLTTTLTLTLAAGINDAALRPVLDLLFGADHVISLMIQPLVFAGRAEALRDRFAPLFIPDVLSLLERAEHPAVRAAHFAPLPCSHPACFSLAFYLVPDSGRAVPMTDLVPAAEMMDYTSNRLFFGLRDGELDRLKERVYELWSGPAANAPDSQSALDAVRSILRSACACGGFDPRQAFQSAERRVKSIFIHAFQDPWTFDLTRARRCCHAYPQRDGRLMPACVFNVIHRHAVGVSDGRV